MSEHASLGRHRDSSTLSVYSLLTMQAERCPDDIAIVAPGRAPLTYHRLHAHLDNTIRELNRLGAGRNDRLALMLPQGPEMAVALTAALAGVTCIPLNPASRASECEFYLSDLSPTVLVLQAGMDLPARSVAARHGIPIVELVPDEGAEAGSFTLMGKDRETCAPWVDAQPGDVALMLYTSGTTSKPKLVPLTHTNLCASARSLRASVSLDRFDRCLDLMPLFHIHGIMVALASLLTGASVACPPRFDATSFFSWLEELLPTWYSAVPPIHHAIATQAGFHRARIAHCPLRFIRSCSAPLPRRVAVDLEQAFSTPVIEAYGMTEAAHQISSNPLPPGQRKDASVGLASGVEIAIIDAAGNPLPAGKTGEVGIRGVSVIRQYANEPAAGVQAFMDGWFRTGDLGRLDSEGYLFLSGRLKEIINRGGTKISPFEVDQVLLAHPAVAQAATFPIPHPTLGEDIATAVMLQNAAPVTSGELRAFLADRLADYKVPQRILFVKDIPKGPTGKLERFRLAEQIGFSAANRAAFGAAAKEASLPPRTPLERYLARIWSELLGVGHVGIQDNFFERGGNSLLAVLAISRVRTLFRMDLPLPILFETPTVAELAAAIAEHLARGPEHAERERLLGELEQLSEAEADRLLAGARADAGGTRHE